MRTPRFLLALSAALLVVGTPALGQAPEEEFAREAQLLEQDLDDYVAARERERAAVQELRDLNVRLTDMLGDLNAPVAEMRRLEGRIATALDRAYRSLRETARARAPIYDQMDRLADLARRLEERPPEPIDEDNPQGLWEFRLDPIGVHALVELEFQPGGVNNSLVAVGTYRSSNGNSGTLRGTFSSSRMDLEVMDARAGKVAEMTGTVGFQGKLEGTWRAVASGLDESRPAGGTWTGHRVASASDVSLD